MTDPLLSKILDTADDGIISIDRAQKIILFNKGAERMFGYDAAEVLGQPLEVLLPREAVRMHRQHVRDFARSQVDSRRMAERGQIAGCRKDGTEFPAEASISKAELDGQRIFTVIVRDITKRQEQEEKVRTALREKEVLLKEIHHRVKNNLQVVVSLLNLQSRGVREDATRKLFRESQHRVQSMALIHEQLYQGQDVSQIDLPIYIRQLVAYLFRAYGVSSSRVRLLTRIERIDLGVDIAVPCGLIINELVSNSLKYAFPDGQKGEISVDFCRRTEGPLLLRVADDGIGFPSGVDFWNTRTLGLRLVRTLAGQLDGHIEMNNVRGAEVQIVFPPGAPSAEG